MKKWKSIAKLSIKEMEEKVNQEWESINILDKSIQNRKDKESFVFYDGPATANGMPGIHHMLSKLLKDTFCKYKTMQGYKVLRKVGWDTHGLPVEVQVEKELGFNGKLDIEKYGLEKFNQKCRESVWKNEASFKEFTKKMGQFIDLENPYITYDNNYIETEWWILKKFFDDGLIYDGLKIVPYCPRCGTGLASHEVSQGYKTISVNTVYVPFKLKDSDAYLLIWTTTPWTLIANVAACVNPKFTYVKVLSQDNKFIVAESLAKKIFGEEVQILEKYQGSDLEGLEYEQFLPFMKTDKKAFYITLADYVTAEDGTGIVHIAPSFGQDDYEVGLKYNLPMLNPVNEQGCYTEGPWKGRLVVDPELEIDIIKYLASENKIFKKQKMEHDYPHCWRCNTSLVYYSRPSLYIKTTSYKDKIIECNNKINWYPSYVGEKRFGNWLENMNDWAISRNRYWGTPIPLWKCSCGHEEMIGSREELVKKSIQKIDESIELHRPFVDDIHLKCSKCGQDMTRVSDVIDCWFDSGSMPFAQYHYPFENRELFESQFPADFISEGIDQTRGWFYSLLVISAFVKGTSPYKNVLVNDLLLDKYGQKMHKSKGNSVSPFSVLDNYGADATRFYMLYASPVWTPLKFDEEGIKEVVSKFFNTLKNTYTFFELYANTDQIDPREYHIEYDELELIDKWLISKYNKLVKEVTSYFDQYDLNKVVHLIQDFVCEDLSNWYIRRNRRRFWSSEFDNSKKAVYQTTYQVLVGIAKLIAPISPYLSELIYTSLTNEKSVHLSDYPTSDEKLINREIEEKMDLIIEFITMGRNAREEAKIKIRQPIQEIILGQKYQSIIKDIDDTIKEELNVKNINYTNNIHQYIKVSYKPNFKVCGKIFGKDMNNFNNYLTSISDTDITKLNNDELTITLNNNQYEITKELVDIKIEALDNYDATVNNNKVLIINTVLTKELISEGLARELVSKIGQIRKNLDLDVADRINIKLESANDFQEQIKDHLDYIKEETLCLSITYTSNINDKYNINDYEVGITINKEKQ